MNHIAVGSMEHFPLSAREVKVAEQQPEYDTMTVVQSPSACFPGAINVVSRWQLTPEERQRIADGEDIYLTLLTANGSPQPVIVSCGPLDWRQQ